MTLRTLYRSTTNELDYEASLDNDDKEKLNSRYQSKRGSLAFFRNFDLAYQDDSDSKSESRDSNSYRSGLKRFAKNFKLWAELRDFSYNTDLKAQKLAAETIAQQDQKSQMVQHGDLEPNSQFTSQHYNSAVGVDNKKYWRPHTMQNLMQQHNLSQNQGKSGYHDKAKTSQCQLYQLSNGNQGQIDLVQNNPLNGNFRPSSQQRLPSQQEHSQFLHETKRQVLENPDRINRIDFNAQRSSHVLAASNDLNKLNLHDDNDSSFIRFQGYNKGFKGKGLNNLDNPRAQSKEKDLTCLPYISSTVIVNEAPKSVGSASPFALFEQKSVPLVQIPPKTSLSSILNQVSGGLLESIQLYKRTDLHMPIRYNVGDQINWEETFLNLRFSTVEEASSFLEHANTGMFVVHGQHIFPSQIPLIQDCEEQNLFGNLNKSDLFHFPLDSVHDGGNADFGGKSNSLAKNLSKIEIDGKIKTYFKLKENRSSPIINYNISEGAAIFSNKFAASMMNSSFGATRILIFKKELKIANRNKPTLKPGVSKQQDLETAKSLFSNTLDINEVKEDFLQIGPIVEIMPIISRKLGFSVHFFDVRDAILAYQICNIKDKDDSTENLPLHEKYHSWTIYYGHDPANKPCFSIEDADV